MSENYEDSLAGIMAEKAKVAEAVGRPEISKLERDRGIARYVFLCRQELARRPKLPQLRIGAPGGVKAMVQRELEISESAVRRPIETDKLTVAAAAEITALGIDNSPRTYLHIAQTAAPYQVDLVREIAARWRPGGVGTRWACGYQR